jgi:predicted nicotinamide N-methyase
VSPSVGNLPIEYSSFSGSVLPNQLSLVYKLFILSSSMNLKITSQTLSVAEREITINLPADPEEMLQQALAGEAAGAADWDPYWGLLWAAAPKTAELLLRESWSSPLMCLEIGCGVGLAGIAALMAGLHVTFSDHAPEAVLMAQANALRNGFHDVNGRVFDWNDPPHEQYDFIFGSDILYDSAGHAPLLRTLDAMLNSDGQVWIGDAGRTNAPLFVRKAEQAGWKIDIRSENGESIAQPRHLQFRLLIMTRR